MAEGLFKRFGSSTPATPAASAGSSADGGLLAPRSGVESRGPSEGEVLAAIDRIPALPSVVTQILRLVGEENSNATDMEELLHQDMSIAGRLLKLVNSPFYALPNEITSIKQAVAIIGYGSMRSLVLAASTSTLLQTRLDAYGFDDAGLWTNSLVTATLAQEVALRTGRRREVADEYFVAGLLRDVGMLAIGPFLERGGHRFRGEYADILEAEEQAIGYHHCWAGERVAEHWELPERLRFAIARHHRVPPEAAPEDLHLIASIRLAERLAYRSNVGLSDDHPFGSQIDARLLGAASLDGAILKELVATIPAILDGARNGAL